MRHGISKTDDGTWTFSLYAPNPERVELHVEGGPGTVAMNRGPDGFWRAEVPGPQAGARYAYVLDGGDKRPDPASHLQEEGVHGPSTLVAHDAFPWTDAGFVPPPREEWVIYELHVGTFTEEGTFQAAIKRLDYLTALGVTTVEVMPVAAFPGERNWGYDGVQPFAVQANYGGPEGFKAFVDAAHARGLAVVLDVVYNHLGPEGNYLREFGPYFTDRYQTPWGEAINFDGPGSDGVRAYFLDNLEHWLTRYHLDGLRLDAVFMIFDERPEHILAELSRRAAEVGERTGREPVLMAEDCLNRASLVRPRDSGGMGMQAMWADDFHHAVHSLLTGERGGYYIDYGALEQVARAMEDGWAYQGEYSPFRRRAHGEPCGHLPGESFVFCIQNHDQVGNRALGERLPSLVSFEACKLAAAALLTAPAVPLLFMGEEFGEDAPFLYFIDHGDKWLLDAVREGRAEEFADFFKDKEPPDPAAPETLAASRIAPEKRLTGRHAAMFAWYSRLLELRRTHQALRRPDKEHCRFWCFEREGLLAMRRGRPGERLLCLFNFSDKPASADPDAFLPGCRVLLDSSNDDFGGTGGEPGLLPPYSARIHEEQT
ncbi:malto-oligosyltrehalose trehalohydrolase [Desulfohalovibrio reitneri]|uniref:malto-oligosyltrehalose trehalohydrolase n=1 Tax=Desulfohalovibrio reitneri TaxID=1307759 RepID=UPI0004A6C545|nr:malto-oligosyltrehalose trehalohydrolase [Desulfohalovibrio reitneri]